MQASILPSCSVLCNALVKTTQLYIRTSQVVHHPQCYFAKLSSLLVLFEPVCAGFLVLSSFKSISYKSINLEELGTESPGKLNICRKATNSGTNFLLWCRFYVCERRKSMLTFRSIAVLFWADLREATRIVSKPVWRLGSLISEFLIIIGHQSFNVCNWWGTCMI